MHSNIKNAIFGLLVLNVLLFVISSINVVVYLVGGVFLWDRSITLFIVLTSIVSLLLFIPILMFDFFAREIRFFGRFIVDLFSLIKPLPLSDSTEKKGKRILVFNWRDLRHAYAGGAEVYIHELAKRWVRSGHQVTLFCGNDGRCPRYEKIDEVKIVRRGGFFFVYMWAFLYYIFRFRGKYDLIIDCENGIPFFTPLYAREKIFLLIHHVHQEVFRTTLKPPFSWIASWLEIKLMPLIYKKIQVITVSPSSKTEIIKHKLTIKEPAVIYNGIDFDRYYPGEKSKEPLVVYVGRLKYYKSLPTFILAAKKVLDKIPHVKFVIAGDGEEKSILTKLVQRLQLTDKIFFLGKVTESEKVRLYQKAWVFVNPSFMEGWGITSIEANACGTPVIASDVPGLCDSVQNPHTGFLVPYGNITAFSEKILALIQDSSLRHHMSQAALKWSRQFDWTVSAQRCLHFFHQS